MKTTFWPSVNRGYANHGWLESYHSFSFANYYRPDRIQFGALRVLNDDRIAGGTGFGMHPHANMEIVSIPLTGALAHQDSTGHKQILTEGEVQLMSAGKGIYHSEMNHLQHDETRFLQIWIIPNQMDGEPGYQQKRFEAANRRNQWQTIVAPNHPEALNIKQNAWFNLIDLDPMQEIAYDFNLTDGGLYLFLLEGEIEAANQILKTRDALAISQTSSVTIRANTAAKLLAMEVPLNF